MILPTDILTENNISMKTHLKYSEDFTFIPIKYKKKCDLCIQTPKIYIPFGINNRFNKQ